MGREAGYCKGRGGSMHIVNMEKGHLGANAIVGGGIPIIRSIMNGLNANEFDSLYGILNGTTNYILTGMARDQTIILTPRSARTTWAAMQRAPLVLASQLANGTLSWARRAATTRA